MEWIGCVRCKKSRRNFVAQTFALIAPVHPVLHRVSCSYKTIWNAPKYCATHQNMSLRFNVADWVRSLRKILAWLRGTTFRMNWTSSHYFAPSFMQLRNDPKCTQTLCNTPKHEFRSNEMDKVRSLRKISTWLRGTNFCINCTSSPVLHRVSCSYKTIPNASKHYGTHQNMRLGSNGADWVHL